LIVPDPAYALVPAPAAEARKVLAQSGVAAGRRYLAVCPRSWLGRTGYLDSLGAALEAVASLDLDVVCVPLHEVQDLPVCEAIGARRALAGRAHVLPPVDSPAVLAAILGSAELAVTMRLHGGILSATAGTPAVIIDYDPKTKAFAAQTGQTPWAVGVDDLEGTPSGLDAAVSGGAAPGAQRLANAIMQTAADLGRRSARLSAAVRPLRAEAGRTAQLAVQLASGGLSSRPGAARSRAVGSSNDAASPGAIR
jgi:polysaccharide pyruvyl transferase WcaK-like protein